MFVLFCFDFVLIFIIIMFQNKSVTFYAESQESATDISKTIILNKLALGGNHTPNQNWACFWVHYLKTINTVLKNDMIILKQIFWVAQFLKCIEISVGPAVLELLVKTCKILFWSKTSERFSLAY